MKLTEYAVIGLLTSFYIALVFPGLRVLIYIVSIAVIFLSFISKRAKLSKESLKEHKEFIIILFLLPVFSFLGYLYNYDFHARYFNELFLIVLPLVISIFFYKRVNYAKVFDISYYLLILIWLGKYYSSILVLFSSFSLSGFLIYSEGIAESSFAFIFGLYIIYYLYTKQPLLCGISFVLMMISSKRIVFLATVIVFMIYFYYKFRKRYSPRKIVIYGLLSNVLIIGLVYLFMFGYLDEIIVKITGININQFSMGRAFLFSSVFSDTNVFSFLGNGLGYSSNLLDVSEFKLKNMHSDILKIMIEYGTPLFLVYYYQLYKVASNKYVLLFIVYFNVIMISDNSIIYIEFMSILLLMIQHAKLKSIQT